MSDQVHVIIDRDWRGNVTGLELKYPLTIDGSKEADRIFKHFFSTSTDPNDSLSQNE